MKTKELTIKMIMKSTVTLKMHHSNKIKDKIKTIPTGKNSKLLNK